jgi:hypothetical protein
MCTMGTPFCAASMIGRWPAGAPGAGVSGRLCARASGCIALSANVHSVAHAMARRALAKEEPPADGEEALRVSPEALPQTLLAVSCTAISWPRERLKTMR